MGSYSIYLRTLEHLEHCSQSSANNLFTAGPHPYSKVSSSPDEHGKDLVGDCLDVTSLRLLCHPDKDVNGVQLPRIEVGDPLVRMIKGQLLHLGHLVEVDHGRERLDSILLSLLLVINPRQCHQNDAGKSCLQSACWMNTQHGGCVKTFGVNTNCIGN